jgi:hypothetical protein
MLYQRWNSLESTHLHQFHLAWNFEYSAHPFNTCLSYILEGRNLSHLGSTFWISVYTKFQPGIVYAQYTCVFSIFFWSVWSCFFFNKCPVSLHRVNQWWINLALGGSFVYIGHIWSQWAWNGSKPSDAFGFLPNECHYAGCIKAHNSLSWVAECTCTAAKEWRLRELLKISQQTPCLFVSD